VRHDRADPDPVQDGPAGVVGVLTDRGERTRPGQHRARPEQQDRHHTVAYPAGMTRVGNLTQRFNQGQRRHRGGIWTEGDLRVIKGGNDRGHLQCGHGLPDVIKDLGILMITSSPGPPSYPIRRVAAGQAPLVATLPRPWVGR
jgi:hypothetical protein